MLSVMCLPALATQESSYPICREYARHPAVMPGVCALFRETCALDHAHELLAGRVIVGVDLQHFCQSLLVKSVGQTVGPMLGSSVAGWDR